ncbi:MAG TPA: D-glycero-beta-D-manno-heptose-7-phosphate kinase [Burkholderiales bacterium]|nr:D-glycero-beta-D-manno-heptose-7-phosphate kinase [Burkholderiales bacterium]
MFTQQHIKFLQQDLAQNKVLVVGDVMLDRYWFGSVDRISPEAPVPIAKISKIEDRPGGAANVARNIASLGGNVTLLSVVGEDEPALVLEKLLLTEQVNTVFKKDSTISTIVKLRVIAKNQQLIRIDFEEKPSHEILAEVLDSFAEIIDQYEVVILSDYGKGGLSHTSKMIEIAKAHNKIVLVDPKGSDYSKYQNATMITPNRSEMRDATGSWNNEQELLNKATELKQQLNLDYLLVTRSEEGMTLFADQAYNYPTFAQEVFDVSGAGDTVIGTIGLMLANNASIREAVEVANFAAGIVVAKLGTATVKKEELIKHLTQHIKEQEV